MMRRACAPSIAPSLFVEEVESHTATSRAPPAWRVPEQLRWPPPAFAPPFVGRLDEEGGLQCAPKARFVKATPEQQFVHGLQLTESERRRQQPKGEW
jgi:hypothetical protein